MRVLVASWLGSTNLGDELVFRGLLTHLEALDASVVAISTNVAETEALHGIRAVRDRDLPGVRAAIRQADLVVFGGGGLLQNQTSHLNLPYHLSRLGWARRAKKPIVGLGLGVGPLDGRLAGLQVRRSFARQGDRDIPISVRDADSQRLLAELGISSRLTADLAYANGPRHHDVGDVLGVCLRPWSGGGGLTASQGWRDGVDTQFLSTMATELDAVIDATGLGIAFIALQSDRDAIIHQEVMARMRNRATCQSLTPTLDELLPALGTCRAVLSMRYHGGVGAALGGRPTLLISYSPKVTSLCEDLAGGAVNVPNDLTGLSDAIREALVKEAERSGATSAAVHHLHDREQENLDILRG